MRRAGAVVEAGPFAAEGKGSVVCERSGRGARACRRSKRRYAWRGMDGGCERCEPWLGGGAGPGKGKKGERFWQGER